MTEQAIGPGFATLALHAGAPADPASAAGTPPTEPPAGVFEDMEQATALFGLEGFGSDVVHSVNPANALLEERVAALEGGTAALAVASGRAAQFLALRMLLQPGDEFITGCGQHGGQMPHVDQTYKSFGWGVKCADQADPKSLEAALTPQTKAILIESFTKPGGRIVDIAAVAKIAKKARVPLIVDNTIATPYLLQPFAHGADLVLHSATKFLGGHDTLTGGLIVDGGTFDWQGDARFPMLSAPRPDYGGMVFAEIFGNFAFAVACRIFGLNELGPTLSPFNAFLIVTGLETLALRMQRHSENALRVAEYLAGHKAVGAVDYPGLARDPTYALAKIYCPRGAGGLLTCRLAGGYEAATSFIQRLRLFSSLGEISDTRSRASHPASTTHRHLSDVEKTASTAGPDRIRLSIGLEDIADILADLDQALAGV